MSLHTTQIHTEVTTEDTVYRFNAFGYENGRVFNGIYPTCIEYEESFIDENGNKKTNNLGKNLEKKDY